MWVDEVAVELKWGEDEELIDFDQCHTEVERTWTGGGRQDGRKDGTLI